MTFELPTFPPCPNDGAALNRHAVMSRLPSGDEIAAGVTDPDEIITDVATCPVCGYTNGFPVPDRPAKATP